MISILMPSRGRPENIERLVQSLRDTADMDNIELIVALDSDDPTLKDYPTYHDFKYTKHIVKERQVLSVYWNICYGLSSGDILMHAGDDIIFRTKGWDKIVEGVFDAYEDKIVFVYGNDGSKVHDGKFGTHGFIHRRWAETVGYFVPPYFSSDYNDTWLNDIAKDIGRHVHIDMMTEHMHPDLGKAEYDQTHKDRIERHQRDNVGALYESKKSEREEQAEILRKVML